MPEKENLSSFFKENKKLLKEYMNTRLEVFRLQMIRSFSKSVGYFFWIILSMFLFFLFMIFLGLVLGFWLSDITGSNIKGFGLTTLIMLFVIILLALLRRILFVNPVIRIIIRKSTADNSHE